MYKPQLDGLRCLAFIGVFCAHWFLHRAWYGGFGVQIFFVLSGYLITGILLDNEAGRLRDRLKAFMCRRALRVFPAYLAILGVLALMGSPAFAKSWPWHASYTYNVYVWLGTFHGKHAELFLNDWYGAGLHLWSMSVEEQYYLVWPFLLWLTPRRFRTPLMILGIVTSIAARIAFDQANPKAWYGALPIVCGEYVLWGGLVAALERGRIRRIIPPIPAILAGSLLFGLLVAVAKPTREPGPLFTQFITVPNDATWALGVQTGYALSFSLVIWGLSNLRGGLLLRVASWPPFVHVGKISYGLYLVHLPIWGLTVSILSRHPTLAEERFRPLIFVVQLAVTVAIASLSWIVLEKPINDLKSRFPYPRGPAGGAVSRDS